MISVYLLLDFSSRGSFSSPLGLFFSGELLHRIFSSSFFFIGIFLHRISRMTRKAILLIGLRTDSRGIWPLANGLRPK